MTHPAHMEDTVDKQYIYTDGFDKMDFDAVTAMLSKTYWCPGISKNEVMQGAENSALVTGAFSTENEQIGFARVVSDKTRFAYILDVIVDERFRKQGVGKNMIRHILAHQDLRDVYQWLLITKDAREVYRKAGFNNLGSPDNWMEIRHPRPER